LGRIRSLRNLDIRRTKVSATGLASLSSMPELRELALGELHVGKAGRKNNLYNF